MKKTLCLLRSLLILGLAVSPLYGQKRLTGFRNDTLLLPTDIRYLGQLGEAMIFSAINGSKEEPALMYSFGEGSDPKPFLNSEGNILQCYQSHIFHDSTLYFYDGCDDIIYQIDPDLRVSGVIEEDSEFFFPYRRVRFFEDLDSRLYALLSTPNGPYRMVSIENNQLVEVLSDIADFLVTENGLFYYLVKEDGSKEVKRFIQEGQIQDLVNIPEAYNLQLNYLTIHDFEYLFISTSTGGFLLKKEINESSEYKITPWGKTHYFATTYFHDIQQDGEHYLYNYQANEIEVHQVKKNGDLTKILTFVIDSSFVTSAAKVPVEIRKIGDYWVYRETYCMYQCVGSKLYFYSVSDSSQKVSTGITHALPNGRKIDYRAIDAEKLAVIDSLTGQEYIYDFDRQVLSISQTFEPKEQKKPVSYFSFKDQQVKVSDNIYLNETPLLPQSHGFLKDIRQELRIDTLSNGFLYWFSTITALNNEWIVNTTIYFQNEAHEVMELYSFRQKEWLPEVKKGGNAFFFTIREDDLIHIKVNKLDLATFTVSTAVVSTHLPGYGFEILAGEDFVAAVSDSLNLRKIVFPLNDTYKSLNVPRGSNFFTTTSHIYLATSEPGKTLRNLYRLTNGEFEHLLKDVIQISKIKNALYVSGKKDNAFHLHRITNIVETLATNLTTSEFTRAGDYFLTGQKVFSWPDFSLLHELPDYTYVYNNYAWQGQTLLLFSNSTLYWIEDKKIIEYSAFENIYLTRLNEYGFLIRTYAASGNTSDNSVHFFLNRAGQKTEIPNVYQPYVLQNNIWIFRNTEETGKLYYFNYATGQIEFLAECQSCSINFTNPSSFILRQGSNAADYFAWVDKGTIKKYEIPFSETYNSLFQAPYARHTGRELVQYTADSMVHYPEIVPGEGGIRLGQVFGNNDQLYVYCYTQKDGWQIWHLGKKLGNEPSLVYEPILATHPEKIRINLYPNPTAGRLKIQAEGHYDYRVTDTYGRLLQQGNTALTPEISIDKLPQGLYLIQFQNADHTETLRIFKN